MKQYNEVLLKRIMLLRVVQSNTKHLRVVEEWAEKRKSEYCRKEE